MVDSLKHLAFDPRATRGRRDKYEVGFNEKPFSIDYEKILKSNATKRLENKTQVFFDPDNPHVQKRSSHTRDVIVISCDVARGLQLSKSLTRAIAAGHDLGHTPYGHLGEAVITEETGHTFEHAKFGVTLLQDIEPLNLSYEVLHGILNHSNKKIDISKITPECRIVQIIDRVAYLFNDTEDILGYGVRKLEQFPPELFYFGDTLEERIQKCVDAIIKESLEMGCVSFEHSEEAKALLRYRDFMYKIYYSLDNEAARSVIRVGFNFLQRPEFEGRDAVIGEALMTDMDAKWIFDTMIKDPNLSLEMLVNKRFSITQVKPYMNKLFIDFEHPDLSWGER